MPTQTPADKQGSSDTWRKPLESKVTKTSKQIEKAQAMTGIKNFKKKL